MKSITIVSVFLVVALQMMPMATGFQHCYAPCQEHQKCSRTRTSVAWAHRHQHQPDHCDYKEGESPVADGSSRRNILQHALLASAAFSTIARRPNQAIAAANSSNIKKCTDIESCRELGEQKIEKDLQDNPRVKLDNGVRYKVLRPGATGGDSEIAVVSKGSTIDLIYSVSKPGAGYMYSQGMGLEKMDVLGNGNLQSDLGMDSLRVKVGGGGGSHHDVPVGIEQALVGMKRGERRRVELPASVGFATSDWKPEPKTKQGKSALDNYRRIVEGNGPNQPPFPAATIWDVEVLKIRK